MFRRLLIVTLLLLMPSLVKAQGAYYQRAPAAPGTIITSPNPAISKVDTQFASPDIDIRNYGAVAVFTSSNPLVNGGRYTINIPASSTTGTLSSSGTGLAKNNWVYIPGAGAAQSMTTPSAPTVTPSVPVGPTGTTVVANAPTGGSTSYAYEIVWVDKGGGYTAASPARTTATGSASLGLQSISISSITQTNNFLTITTAARSPEVFTPSQLIVLATTSYGEGYYNVWSIPNNTTIVVQQGLDTRNGGIFNTAAYTGGTIFYWNLNRITLPTPPTGAWQALIYGRTSGSYTLLGESLPYDSISGLGTWWDDYGSTMMASPTVPNWAPASPPSAAFNDALSAQITALSGANVTLSVASGSGSGFCGTGTCSAAWVLLDDGPALVAAAKAAANNVSYPGGEVYIPATGSAQGWPIQSFTDLSTANIPAPVTIIHTSGLYLNATISIGNVTWKSDVDVTSTQGEAWGITSGAGIGVAHAYPAFFVANGTGLNISGTQFSNPANLYVDVWAQGQLPTGVMKNFGISGGGTSDMMGIPLIFATSYSAGNAGVVLDKFSVSTGPTQVTSTSTPLIWNQGFGEFTMRDYFLNRRGYFQQVSCASGSDLIAESNFEREGGITPMYMFQPECNGSGLVAKIYNQIQDSESVNFASNIAGPGGNALNLTLILDTPGSVTGYPISYISMPNNIYLPQYSGQNTAFNGWITGLAYDGVFNAGPKNTWNALQGIGTGYSSFIESAPSAAPTLSTPTSGGSLPYVSTGYTIQVAPVFNEAGRYAEGTISPVSNSETVSSTCTTSGNCTIPAKWSAVTGAVGYDVYINGKALNNSAPPQLSASTLSTNISSYSGTVTQGFYSGGGPVGMNVNGMWVNSNPVTQTIASGTVSLGTSPIASNTCASVVTATASGVLTMDTIQADFNSNPTSTLGYEPGAMLTIIKYPTAGNVNFIVCNNTRSSITPGAVTLNWRVVR